MFTITRKISLLALALVTITVVSDVWGMEKNETTELELKYDPHMTAEKITDALKDLPDLSKIKTLYLNTYENAELVNAIFEKCTNLEYLELFQFNGPEVGCTKESRKTFNDIKWEKLRKLKTLMMSYTGTDTEQLNNLIEKLPSLKSFIGQGQTRCGVFTKFGNPSKNWQNLEGLHFLGYFIQSPDELPLVLKACEKKNGTLELKTLTVTRSNGGKQNGPDIDWSKFKKLTSLTLYKSGLLKKTSIECIFNQCPRLENVYTGERKPFYYTPFWNLPCEKYGLNYTRRKTKEKLLEEQQEDKEQEKCEQKELQLEQEERLKQEKKETILSYIKSFFGSLLFGLLTPNLTGNSFIDTLILSITAGASAHKEIQPIPQILDLHTKKPWVNSAIRFTGAVTGKLLQKPVWDMAKKVLSKNQKIDTLKNRW